jgi:hypothetical protein
VVLSWRWDITKGSSIEETRPLKSPKVVRFVKEARAKGFKYAWVDFATVPQHPCDVNETMVHVHASRSLYEHCMVIIVDLEPIFPGFEMVSLNYMERLWTTAEMSAMLNNSNVNQSNFIRISKWNHDTICAGLWANALTLETFRVNYETWKSEQRCVIHSSIGKRVEGLVRNIATGRGMYDGAPWMMKKYGKKAAKFLYELTQLANEKAALFFASTDKPYFIDRRHESDELPMTETEQEQLIADFETTGLTCNIVRSFVKEMNRTRHPTHEFSVYDHYPALLLLGYECVKYHSESIKWNQRCFDVLLDSLGETFHLPGTPPTYSLKATDPTDRAKVKRMILNENTCSKPCIDIPGIELLMFPKNHIIKRDIKIEQNMKTLLLQLNMFANTIAVQISRRISILEFDTVYQQPEEIVRGFDLTFIDDTGAEICIFEMGNMKILSQEGKGRQQANSARTSNFILQLRDICSPKARSSAKSHIISAVLFVEGFEVGMVGALMEKMESLPLLRDEKLSKKKSRDHQRLLLSMMKQSKIKVINEQRRFGVCL